MSTPRSSEARTSVVAVAALTARQREGMLALMDAHYLGVLPAVFERDLAEKESAVLLERAGRVVGFTTIATLEMVVHDVAVTAFFSGDTVVERSARGDAALLRAWGDCVFGRASALRDREPARRVYWLLISAGYATYRFLPAFFRHYLPRREGAVSTFDRAVADALAAARYGERYDPRSGVVRLDHPTPLRPGVADAGLHAHDPHVAYFVERNPGHAAGDELVCLTRIDERNLTRAGLRALGRRTPRGTVLT